MSNHTPRKAAKRRLMRDLREWNSSQHLAKSITAIPLDKDIFTWHCNFFPDHGPLKEIIFHLIVTFPHNYPESPPKVSVCNTLIHPNVFGSYVCLNMLRENQWCRAYSVSSILFQLLSFLITKKAPQDHGPPVTVRYTQSEIDTMYNASERFRCNRCKHTFLRPFPAINDPLWTAKVVKKYGLKQRKNGKKKHLKIISINMSPKTSVNYWYKTMSEDVENIVIQFLNVSELISFGRVNNRFKHTVQGFSKYIRMTRFNCWYHRIDLRYSTHLQTLKSGDRKSVV